MKADPLIVEHATILALAAPRQLTYLELPLPPIGEADVVVQTLYSGISHGTEMNVYRGLAPQLSEYFEPVLRLFLPVSQTVQPQPPGRGYWKPSDSNWGYPLAYGYANVGRVVECGNSVTSLKKGDLVYAFEPHQNYYVAPAASVIRLPELQNPAEGIFYANMNTAYNGVLDAGIHIDDVVVIFGLGVVGLLVTQFARRTAAQKIVVVDPMPERRLLGLQMGADIALAPEEVDVAKAVREMTNGRGADVVIEVSGSYAALHEAIRTAAYNTTVTAMSWYGGNGEALRLANEFHHNRISIRSSQVGGMAPELSATHDIVRRGKNVIAAFTSLQLSPLLTHYVPFTAASDGYALVDRRDASVLQVVLEY
jgi:2-desacetyl-2-hydroxyethyl bacteriochlorophyllide A dehydrogenase